MYLVSVLHRDPRAGKKLQGVSTLKQCQAKLEQARARAEAVRSVEKPIPDQCEP